MAGGEAPAPYKEPSGPSEAKVKDPAIPNRMVSTKMANKPFLALTYKEYREKQERLHYDRRSGRPTGLLKFLVYLLLFIALTGKFITGSYL
ncbi:hypothetical protein PLEOSDRAFT_1101089 [Pleurotus ostreatus PC15]|uniref:Uncharacterized protein n=1 Tax=Pleurotus ostreatus (strain PC15) TaxID=1137138 RepID=A0A067P0Y0_PLEO1|nr:hypothetical protein PLEOSDRAFT_1101089 [Pleurotus ostreatus PC15]